MSKIKFNNDRLHFIAIWPAMALKNSLVIGGEIKWLSR